MVRVRALSRATGESTVLYLSMILPTVCTGFFSSSCQESSATAFVPPTIGEGDLFFQLDCGLTPEQHKIGNKWICDLLEILGPPSSPKEVIDDPVVAARILWLLLRTASPHYKVKPEYESLDNLRALAEHNKKFCQGLAAAYRFKGFTTLRAMAFWYEWEAPEHSL
ncbi:hypothetical protein OBBRIDRAFT_891178 [Obba rivulosa]|uniref:Uncharacterized protein n=1 Tax=Obba rivulosa TaxID=1052685 RepID=A0A8E2DH34_9APHY|nr:hypothetical protein OBBRIDRAFT_891178 [Obba rivulosa]